MSDPRAVAIARTHIEAWANHEFGTARSMLANDVRVAATSTAQDVPKGELVGADAYMEGLTSFAGAVDPGSQNVLAAVGDEANALITLTVTMNSGKTTLHGARLYLINDDGKIQAEQVIFYVTPA
jgi:hypothetical protein